MKGFLKEIFLKIGYWYMSAVDTNAEVIFMNYGYSANNYTLKLNHEDEKNRYSIQLYNYVASAIDVKGKDILEVGCGRGGGISYINRAFSPKSATGLDLNKKAISFCNTYYTNEAITFLQGDAQKLPFQDITFDVVVNIESSHRYPQMNRFLREVNRVLKPGGYFLFADFRTKKKLAILNQQLIDSNLKVVKEIIITEHVLEALKFSSNARENLIIKLTPRILHNAGRKFAATEGTPTYNKFVNHKIEYLFYILKK
jgi:ubiquinone/menaquinone biosynthesis C-methylase UbiE